MLRPTYRQLSTLHRCRVRGCPGDLVPNSGLEDGQYQVIHISASCGSLYVLLEIARATDFFEQQFFPVESRIETRSQFTLFMLKRDLEISRILFRICGSIVPFLYPGVGGTI